MGLKLPTIAGLLLLPSQKIGKQVKIRTYSRTQISQLLVQLFLYSVSLMQPQEFPPQQSKEIKPGFSLPCMSLPSLVAIFTGDCLWIPYRHHCCFLYQPLLREMCCRLNDVPSPFPRNNSSHVTISVFHWYYLRILSTQLCNRHTEAFLPGWNHVLTK